MRFTVIAAVLSLTGAITIHKNYDASDPLGRNVAKDQHGEMHLSGYNGADEDEIMDNVFSRYSKEGRTPSGHKTGQKLLMKDEAKIAAGTILEAAHKLRPQEVPGWLDTNFEKSWDHFDQNHEGWIRYEETHTFQRHLMGSLNGFALSPGSISDMTSGGKAYPLPFPVGSEAIAVGAV